MVQVVCKKKNIFGHACAETEVVLRRFRNSDMALRKKCQKKILSYSGPNFPAFGLNTERYSVSLRIHSECGKMRTRITPNMDNFYIVWCNLKHYGYLQLLLLCNTFKWNLA